ncbi:unnamed protein product [Caenorhabditis angaria]|uniref:Uncharacterized protein n=1 Tax=Caenorhabditis angaria TaxID=860376 RepID=A0A9P1IZ39_9PELO|nr:unnamed protein product [Caenorhabditis angaria]
MIRRNFIFIFIISFAIADDFMLFIVFQQKIPQNSKCSKYFCATPPGYRTYEIAHTCFYGALSYTLSIVLCVKLFKSMPIIEDARRVNKKRDIFQTFKISVERALCY